ncbi:follistatin-like [Homarus americanus]|uniref:follistatin-like n=1 Tax=Homarus americanus TaxID=6706 RepID=UPI001C4969C9|nr:follistatin-like [Homarus americanus]XP_042232602.1 follistatin-like [Homarus americanus]XP_042232603.1 follistatin-like [Homarus americanus]XP_042232604.1 follistatin-like [Homarus americanus]
MNTGKMGGRRKPPTIHTQLLVLQLALLLLPLLQVTAATSGSDVGSCWRLKRRDGSCGRLLKKDVTKDICCSGRHSRGWSVASMTLLKPFNATSVLPSDFSTAEENCSPCSTTCAGVRCGEDRKCVVRCGAPRCVCSPQCHLKHKEAVCGSDGRSYKSECHLLKRACRKKKRLLVAHYGPCQTCSGVRCAGGKKCVLDEQMTPRCVRCPSTCPPLPKPRPLCAADDHTYISPCHLRRASCRAAAEIPRAYKGPCREDATCSDVRCWRKERCLTRPDNSKPQCTLCDSLDSCRPSSRPVCASDGRTYPSWCAFRHEACRSGRALMPTLHHHCAASHLSPGTQSIPLYTCQQLVSDHTQADDCNKHHYKHKKTKYRRRQDQLREEENELRQVLVTQRVLQGVAEVTGTSTLGKFDLEDNANNIEGGGGGVAGTGSRRKVNSNSAVLTDKRKKRKRRRRRRNCKKNRKRTRKERQRTRKEHKTRVEGD